MSIRSNLFLGIALLVSANTLAQEGTTDEMTEVVVTGSRVVTDALASPTPLTVVTAVESQLAKPGAPIDSLIMLPSLSTSNSARNAQAMGGLAQGAESLNLRNLGGGRTLVLVDGRRLFATSLVGGADTRLVPQALISRVDIVTGGASAAYGSDAVAGVVNLVLDKDFVGLKGVAQAGISQYGDGASQRFELTGGTPFSGGNGHVLLSVATAHQQSIDYESARSWALNNAALVQVAGNVPTNLRLNNVGSAATYGGVILSGPFANTMFAAGGVPVPFTPGTITTAQAIVGSPDTSNTYGTIAAGYQLINPFARVSYDVSESFKPFVQLSGSENRIHYRPNDPIEFGTFGYTIFSGNPFIPPSIQAQMTAQNIASFPLARQSRDFGIPKAYQRNTVFNGVIGATGQLGASSWNYDVSFDHGQTRTQAEIRNDPNRQHHFAAADAVVDPATGRIVCRANLTNPGSRPGCVPINLFGVGSPSPEAIAYATGLEYWTLKIEQQVAAASVNGDLFSLPAGRVRGAVGAEYRRVDMSQIADPVGTLVKNADGVVRGFPPALNNTIGGWELGNNGSTAGDYSIKEGFLEVNLPLLSEAPLARSLDINGAARYAHYSTSGGVTTWKVGLAYQPIEDLRLRATQSRDIRAANLGELYTATASGAGTVNDTITGRGNVGILSQTIGNPTLGPEEADTFTAGITYRPSWFSGFGMSIDYYDIDISGAIQTLGAQQLVNQCRDGSADACAQIVRGADGNISVIFNRFLNLANFKTSGFEGEVSYTTQAWGGELSFRALALYLDHYISQIPGGLPNDTAGVIGVGAGASGPVGGNSAEWQSNLRVTYKREPLTLFVQQRYIGKGIFDNTQVEGVTINDNSIPAMFYTDVTAEYKFAAFGGNAGAFFTVNNLFDKAPPPVESSSFIFHPQTNGLLYDKMGRYFTAGVRFAF